MPGYMMKPKKGKKVMGKSQVASIFKRGKDAIRKNKKV